jgi:hypothetical protein
MLFALRLSVPRRVEEPKVYNIHRYLGNPILMELPDLPFTTSFIYRCKSYEIKIQKASIGKGWDWESLGQSGRRETKEQSLASAREYIISVNS